MLQVFFLLHRKGGVHHQSSSMLILYVTQLISCLSSGMLQFFTLGGTPLYRSTKIPQSKTIFHSQPSLTPPPPSSSSSCLLSLSSNKFMPPKENPKNVWRTLKLTTCSSPTARLFTDVPRRSQESIMDTDVLLFRFGGKMRADFCQYMTLYFCLCVCVQTHCSPYHLGELEAAAI